jgi:tetratricopeptide (TPR) repeat protein
MARIYLFFLLVLGFNVFLNSSVAKAIDKTKQIYITIDSLTSKQAINTEEIDEAIKALQRINLSFYYEEYKNEGPLQKLTDYCHQNKLISQEIACINIMGVMFRQIGKPSESEEIHLHALELSKTYNDTINMMMSLNNLGVNARRIDDLKKASDYHIEVLNLSSKFSNKSNVTKKSTCIALNSIGNINISLKQYDKAIEVFKQSNAIEQTMNSAIGQAINHANIGEAYELSGKLDSAKQHYIQSLEFNVIAESNLGIALCNNNLGTIYLTEQKYDQAITYFEKAIPLMRTTGDKYHLIISLQSAAKAWIGKKEYRKASVFLDEANQLAYAINSKVFLKEGFNLLSKIKEATGNYQEALKLVNLSHQYSDSIFNEENQRHLIDIQTRYETEQKEQQIALLNSDNELKNTRLKYQKLVIWSGSIAFILITSFSWFMVWIRRKRQHVHQVELEQKLLRSQMNPHFIFNSLGAIQSYMMKNDGRKAAFYLSSFSSLMRSILKNSREEWITLQEEKQTLENYLNLHQLRLGEKLSYSVFISEEIDPKGIAIPPMLIQPFIENAIIHGIEKTDKNGFITLSFEKERNLLKITIDDNGPGFDNLSPKQNHISYALQIFKERVINLKRNFGLEISYNIIDKRLVGNQNSGTLVTVKLTLKPA